MSRLTEEKNSYEQTDQSARSFLFLNNHNIRTD